MTYRISIAIPNYNYGQYLGRTIQSVLDQGDPDIEVVVSDNASTDDSVEIIHRFQDPRVRVHVNPVNVGFAPNLDRAVDAATGEHVILLSSDDLMLPGALASYRRMLETSEDRATTVLTSRYTTIDADDVPISSSSWPSKLANSFSAHEPLTGVHRLQPTDALNWSFRNLKNPFAFATVCYPRSLWWKIGGYLGSRQINPDKWFHWRLLGVASAVLVCDTELFGYRVHGANQTAAARGTGALKYLQDQYTYTYETPDELLQLAAVERAELVEAFLTHDVVARAFVHLADSDPAEARRFLRFGAAAYPVQARASARWWAARFASITGPIGIWASRTGLRLLEIQGSFGRDRGAAATWPRSVHAERRFTAS